MRTKALRDSATVAESQPTPATQICKKENYKVNIHNMTGEELHVYSMNQVDSDNQLTLLSTNERRALHSN